MSGTDLEHRTEIRRANRTTPIWVGLVVLVAAVVLLLGTGTGGGVEDVGGDGPTTVPATPTSETLTTTSPREQLPVYGMAERHRGVLPFSTATTPMADSASGERHELELAGGPIVTGDRVVALDTSQVLHVGEPGRSFRRAGCCWADIHPSTEPDHVWGRVDQRLTLIDLDAVLPVGPVILDVGDEQVLGPASFGVVTVDDRGVVRWHRPSFEPTVVALPPDRRALDSGGERLLVSAPATDEHPARLETWSIAGGGILAAHDLDEGVRAEGVLSPDGSVVLVRAPGGWAVRSAATGLLHGRLPEVSGPVWVGGHRFAAALDGRLVVSDDGELPLAWPVLAVAEQSP